MASKTRIVEIIRRDNGRYSWWLKSRNGYVIGQCEGPGYVKKHAAYQNAAKTIEDFDGCRGKDLAVGPRSKDLSRPALETVTA